MAIHHAQRLHDQKVRKQKLQKTVESLQRLQNQSAPPNPMQDAAPPVARGDLMDDLRSVIGQVRLLCGLPDEQFREAARRVFLGYLEQWDQAEGK